MSKITKEFIRNELNKIANSINIVISDKKSPEVSEKTIDEVPTDKDSPQKKYDIFEDFEPRTRIVLESLPVKWSKPQISDKKIILKWNPNPTWAEATIPGSYNGNPIELHIERTSSRFFYTLRYLEKTYTVEKLKDLKNLLIDLKEGITAKPQIMQEIFNQISRKENNLKNYSVKYYLSQITNKDWAVDISHDNSYKRIYVKFSAKASSDEERNEFNRLLEEHDKLRVNSVGSYLKKLLKESEIKIDDLKFTQRLLSISNKSGFLITITY